MQSSRRAAATRTTPRPTRAGFTLVEVVVATLLLAIAALGVASTTTFVARLAASARALADASRALASTVDSLRSIPCTSLGAGTAGTRVGTVQWTATATATGDTRQLRATLAPSSPRLNAPPIVEEVVLPCR